MNIKIILIALIIFLVSLSRIFPHPPNFTPILALAIFGGAFLPNKKTALFLPIGAMFLSDLFIGFHSQIFAVYGSIILLSYLGNTMEKKKIFFSEKLLIQINLKLMAACYELITLSNYPYILNQAK